MPKNILFVCSRNRWRSPTAERVWRNHPDLNVRSAGTSSSARKTISPADIGWADVIFVMEYQQKRKLVANFGQLVAHKPLVVLDIPDDYHYMDPELVTILQETVADYLDL